MRVKLIEPALQALLAAEDGPVGVEIEDRARRITSIAAFNAGLIMHRYPFVTADIDYEIGPQLTTIIGIRDRGKMSRYLADKEVREKKWLYPAVQEVFPP